MTTMKKAFFAMAFMNFFVYGLNAIYNCFVPLYLGNYFDAIAVGALLSIGPVMMMLSPMLWGGIADKAKLKNNVFVLIIVCSAAVFFGTMLSQNLIYTGVMLAVLMFFMAPFGGIMDTITLEAANSLKINYGPIRLIGTIGYGLISILVSALPSENTLLLAFTFVLVALCGTLCIKMAPPVAGHAVRREKNSIGPLLRDRNLWLILIVIFVNVFIFSYYSNFMPGYMTGELGLPTIVWGINVFTTLFVEFPFFAFFDRIMRYFSIRKILLATVALCAVRYAIFALTTNAWIIVGSGAITGAWITVAIYCGTYYINATAPANIKASGQSFMYAIAYGTPKVLAGIGGGFMTQYLGVRNSYWICAAMSAVCIIPVLLISRRTKSDEITGVRE